MEAGDPAIRGHATAALVSFHHDAGRAAPQLARNLEAEEAAAIIDRLRAAVAGAGDQHAAAAALANALQPDRGTRMRVTAAKARGRFRPDPALWKIGAIPCSRSAGSPRRRIRGPTRWSPS